MRFRIKKKETESARIPSPFSVYSICNEHSARNRMAVIYLAGIAAPGVSLKTVDALPLSLPLPHQPHLALPVPPVSCDISKKYILFVNIEGKT